MFDGLGAERLADDVGGRRERGVDVADLDLARRQQVAGLVDPGRVVLEGGHRVDDGRQHLVVDLDQRRGLAGRMTGLGGHHREHVADVAGGLAFGDQQRPILEDEALEALAGDVAPGGHPDHARDLLGRRGIDPFDDRARVGRQGDGAVEHARDDHVADEREIAQDERATVVAVGAGPDAELGGGRRGGRLATPDRSHRLERVEHLDVARAATQVPGERRGRAPHAWAPGRGRASPRPSSRCPGCSSRIAPRRRSRTLRPTGRGSPREAPRASPPPRPAPGRRPGRTRRRHGR